MRDLVLHFALLSLWGGIATLGAWAVSALLRRFHTPSRLLCWLWLAVGVRFALPWGIPLTLPRPRNQQLAQAADTVQALAESPAPMDLPAAPAPTVAAVSATPWYTRLTVWHLLAAVWAVGVLVLAVRAVLGYARLRHTVALACKTNDGCYSGDCVPVPFTLGILRPRIYLPAALTGRTRRAVLLHEQTHLRRHDPQIKPLFYAVVCLHWFNPLAWLAFRELGRAMEQACDEAALRGRTPAERAAYCESLLQFALLQQLLEVGPRVPLEQTAQGIGRQLQPGGDLLQGAAAVGGFDVLQRREHRVFVPAVRQGAVDGLGKEGQVLQQQPHGGLVEQIHPGFFLQQRPDHVLQKIFHRQDVPRRNVQPACKGRLPGQCGDEEIPQHVLLFQHPEAAVKELGQNDEVDSHVPLAGGQDLVVDRLVEEQQVPLAQHQFSAAVEDVGGGATAHVEHLHIIMTMPRKMHKPRMGANLDKFALFQQLVTVHHKIPAGGVSLPLDALPRQDGLFLLGDGAQLRQ